MAPWKPKRRVGRCKCRFLLVFVSYFLITGATICASCWRDFCVFKRIYALMNSGYATIVPCSHIFQLRIVDKEPLRTIHFHSSLGQAASFFCAGSSTSIYRIFSISIQSKYIALGPGLYGCSVLGACRWPSVQSGVSGMLICLKWPAPIKSKSDVILMKSSLY